MKNKIVRHVKQGETEFYRWNPEFRVFQNVPRSDADDWAPDSFEYIELRHDMPKNKHGLYGHVITV